MALAVATTALAVLWAVPAKAGTPIQIGQLSPGNPALCGPSNFVQTAVAGAPSYTVPSDGVITSWSHKGHAMTPGFGRLQVWRPAGAPNFTLVARSANQTFAAGINNFATNIPVSAGDLLGLRLSTSNGGCFFSSITSGDVARSDGSGSSDAAPGETRDMSTTLVSRRLNVSATLDPTDPPDTSVSLTADAKKKQKVGKLKISVSGGDEAISGEIGGKAVAKKRAGATAAAKKKTKKKIKPKSFSVAAGATESVGVKFKNHGKSVKKLRKLLKRKGFRKNSKAKVKISVTDLAGNSANETVKIKLKP